MTVDTILLCLVLALVIAFLSLMMLGWSLHFWRQDASTARYALSIALLFALYSLCVLLFEVVFLLIHHQGVLSCLSI